MKDFIRTLFGIRQKRKCLPPSPPPGSRTTLVRGVVKMSVNTEISADLWDWLMLSGWRVNTYRNDRRKYNVMPESAISQLMTASSSERSNLHKKLLYSAIAESTGGAFQAKLQSR